jgi:hypothetical protein
MAEGYRLGFSQANPGHERRLDQKVKKPGQPDQHEYHRQESGPDQDIHTRVEDLGHKMVEVESHPKQVLAWIEG